jgi:hypothetical protein
MLTVVVGGGGANVGGDLVDALMREVAALVRSAVWDGVASDEAKRSGAPHEWRRAAAVRHGVKRRA